ncbi:hypothetical protein AX16_008401 [Volvariella volvacea WC 439]|nr:hypothetical protein AX16_008401 [Volvariella volvacea WC 439]
MSSIQSPAPTLGEASQAQPAPTESPIPVTGGGNGPNSSNLYLITFLATLFLLLFVSCAIVFRSYILRRRFQRHIDEAVAAGLLLPPRAPGSKKRRYGSKPKFHDAWLRSGGETWAEMMPVCAQPISRKRTKDTPAPPTPRPTVAAFVYTPEAAAQESGPTMFSPTLAWSQFWRRTTASPNNRPPTPQQQQPESQTKQRPTSLQVAVLIAMPNPNGSKRSESPPLKNYEEEEIPDVVFGITRLPWKPELDS